MSAKDVEEHSASLRAISTGIFVFAAGGPAVTFVLLFSAAKTEKTAFVLLLQIFCFFNAVGSLSGWLSLNASFWLPSSVLMLSFGPGYLLGPRFVHAVDFVAMLANVWTPTFIVEMMIFRTLIVFNVKFSKRTMLLATSIPILYSVGICIPSLNYVDVNGIRAEITNMSDFLLNETYNRVCYVVDLGEFGIELWNLDTYVRGAIVIICFLLASLMVWKLHTLRGVMSEETRKVHKAFLIEMDRITTMSDTQLRDELKSYGFNVGPLTGTTRGVYEKKLFKLKQGTPSAASKAKKLATPPPAQKSASARSTRKSSRRPQNKSENEEGSDDEIEIISPKQNFTPTARKPVSSTPTKERTPSPPVSRRLSVRPANNIIPGLNTTRSEIRTTTNNSSKLLINTPSGDNPGSTPPRKAFKIPVRPVTHTSATVTSSFLSPDGSFTASPKFVVHSSLSKRNLTNLGHTTEEDDSDAGEETSRTVHNIVSSGRDHRNGVRRALDGILGNNLSAGNHPGTNYELRRGTVRTDVYRNPKTGRLSVKQRSIWSDTSCVILMGLVIFLAVLGTAYVYVVSSGPVTVTEAFNILKNAGRDTADILKNAGRDTAEFFYRYAVVPVAVVTGVSLFLACGFFGLRWYREKQAEEQQAFEDLVEKIIDMVQDETENGEENITVPHVRDKMYRPAKRTPADMARWERAVNFINENESRIATECALIRGQECQVWRWVPYKKSGWQGSVFPTPVAQRPSEDRGAKPPEKYLSSNIPEIALTRCLKVRDLHENREGKHPLEPVNYDALKYKVLEKVYPVRPVHLTFDLTTKEPVLYMKLNNKEDAKDAFTALHAKWFNGHLVTVKYVRDSRYAERYPCTSNV